MFDSRPIEQDFESICGINLSLPDLLHQVNNNATREIREYLHRYYSRIYRQITHIELRAECVGTSIDYRYEVVELELRISATVHRQEPVYFTRDINTDCDPVYNSIEPEPIRFVYYARIPIEIRLLQLHYGHCVDLIVDVVSQYFIEHIANLFGVDPNSDRRIIAERERTYNRDYSYGHYTTRYDSRPNYETGIGSISSDDMQRSIDAVRERINQSIENRLFDNGKNEKEEANKKANNLLYSCLSTNQRKCYTRYGYFFVIGNITGNRYKLVRKKQINIYRVNKKGKTLSKHCVVSDKEVPMGDHLLAQKLLIETNEEEFLMVKIDWNTEYIHTNVNINYVNTDVERERFLSQPFTWSSV